MNLWPFKRQNGAPVQQPPHKKRFLRTLGQLFKSAAVNKNDDWNAFLVSPDAFILSHQQKLVARSREQWSNNDYVRAFIRLIRQNVVGPNGIGMQSRVMKARGGLDKENSDAIEAAWCEWTEKGNCDVTGQLSFREVCELAAATTARDGEFVVRIVRSADAGPWGFALQMIDPQRLPIWYQQARGEEPGSFIRHGIEYNKFGRPIAYHFSSVEESDAAYYVYAGRGFVRVPADEVIFDFIHELVSQKRGLPWASTSLFRLHHLQGFEDAAVQNARASATKMGFIQYRDGFGPELDDDEPLEIEAEPLSMHELPTGAEFKEFSPNYPSGEFAQFHKAMLRGAAAGMGVLYNNVAGDLEGVNFSSIRQGTLDEREHYKALQRWLLESLVTKVFNAWLGYSLLAGKIVTKAGRPLPAARLQAFKAVAWQPPRWQWIDPRADVDGAISSIRAGLNSPQQVIREQGRDPETVVQEIADYVKSLSEAGIQDDLIHQFMFGQPPKPEAKQADGGSESKE